jgi:hypothetical protein
MNFSPTIATFQPRSTRSCFVEKNLLAWRERRWWYSVESVNYFGCFRFGRLSDGADVLLRVLTIS